MVAVRFLLLLVVFSVCDGFAPTSVKRSLSPRTLKAVVRRGEVGDKYRENVWKEASAGNEAIGMAWSSENAGRAKAKQTQRENNSRRSFLRTGLSTVSAGIVAPIVLGTGNARAAEQLQHDGSKSFPNLKCLLDLPPVAPGSVRLYLCRHGQTENNRLRLVQGARVDPPLNDTGLSMAGRLGAALSFLSDDMAPTVAAHSLLKRARETATVADVTIGKIRASTEDGRRNLVGMESSYRNDPVDLISASAFSFPRSESGEVKVSTETLPLSLRAIPSLGEVDFGATIEGKSVAEAQASMYATYGAWSAGKIDQVMEGEGESGRQVLYRAASAIETLADLASKTGGSVVAVSHSTYLRMLLATVLNIPLAQASMLEQKNGCINVLDVNLHGPLKEIGPKSELFGGKLSMARDFSLSLPETKVIRVNETRHLNGLV